MTDRVEHNRAQQGEPLVAEPERSGGRRSQHVRPIAKASRPEQGRKLKARQRAETRFRWYGRLAITFAVGILLLLVVSLVVRGASGFQQAQILLPATQASPEARPLRQALNALSGGQLDTAEALPLASINARREYRPGADGAYPAQWVTASETVDLWMKGTLRGKELIDRGRLTEAQLLWLRQWKQDGRLELAFNRNFFTGGDSREPELAGFLGAAMGSVLTLLVCMALAFPVGVASAVYLEEFAPTNRFTDAIEVNINNLAAVPSIVFGLLGLSVYLNFFELPRSAALVGGLTLALLVLPVIIIASRASLRAVPPSIRDGARAVGASDMQVITHHVLPLALPGILTGTILSVARAIGETAPLLMIGMVAFVADVPAGFTDPATAMPVQIYLWASSPELSFVQKTAAGILVLLAILFTLNLLAIWLRRKYEVRW